MKKLLCIDGNSILNRQFYGIRYLSNKEGFPTNAIFGFVNVILKQLEALKPDYTAVAFDLKAPTFRHTMYDAYKAGRKPMPDDLALQMPVAKEICRAMGFTVLEKEGYEADDILGTLAAMAQNSGGEVEGYVLTGDKDSLQLISENVKVLLATNSDTVTFDDKAFFEKYGVWARQYVDVKALMGDSSDNIPGVAGIGEKTAFKLIAEMKSLDALYENLEEAGVTASVKNKLISGKDSAFMSRALAQIKCDSPIGIELADIENHGIDREGARALFAKYELFGAMKRLGLDKEEARVADVSQDCPDCVDLQNLDGEFLAMSIDRENVYFSDGNKLCKAVFDEDSRSFIKSHKIICFDCKSIYKLLEEKGFYWRDCYFDVMLGAYVDDSLQSSYSLERLVTTYIGESLSLEIPEAHYVAQMWKKIEDKLSESGQLDLLYNIEMPLAAVLCDMELEGCKIDQEGIANYGIVLDEIISALEMRIYTSAGEEFNINSPKQLGEVLFEKLMLPSGKKTKTGYSTSAEVLEGLSKYHPIIEDILEYRQMSKLKGTYVDGLLKCVGDDGRIHTEFKQTGTATGRLSSINPNLQNIPIRTEAGRQFRKYFVAKNQNYVLIDADYSQIELRVFAHISGDEHMSEAFMSNSDIHTATACRVFGVSPENVSIEMRKKAKAINFGILYGMGEFSLAEDLKIPRYEAKDYIDSYLNSYPAIEQYLENIVRDAHRQGYVTTMFGRRRYIPEISASNKNLQKFGERVAKNSPIQGSSADIIKIAMINTHKKLRESGTGAKLLLQVHDELLIECPREHKEEVLLLLTKEMENATRLSVPLKVEAKSGDNWLECH